MNEYQEDINKMIDFAVTSPEFMTEYMGKLENYYKKRDRVNNI